jgi:hypothetical protein
MVAEVVEVVQPAVSGSRDFPRSTIVPVHAVRLQLYSLHNIGLIKVQMNQQQCSRSDQPCTYSAFQLIKWWQPHPRTLQSTAGGLKSSAQLLVEVGRCAVGVGLMRR